MLIWKIRLRKLLRYDIIKELKDSETELFRVVTYIKGKFYMIDELSFSGGPENVNIPNAEVIAAVCRAYGVREVIFIHNHPQNEDESHLPSEIDLKATLGYHTVLKEDYGIKLIDHLVVSKNGKHHFIRQAGWLAAA